MEREAYYGGTFVGNHVNKCLKVHVYHMHYIYFDCKFTMGPHLFVPAGNIATLCQSVVGVESECPALTDAARSLSQQLVETFSLFSACTVPKHSLERT